jgi:hypothetical protein
MKIRYSAVATAILAVVCATSVAKAEGTPTGSNMQNNSGTKTPDEQDTNKRSMAPAAGQAAPARTTGAGSGATNTDSGRANPDEQDHSRGKGPSTPTPPVGSR